MDKSKKTDFSFPLPPEKLHTRYDKVFEGFKRGLSSTIIGLPHSGRSSGFRFITSYDPIFRSEFADLETKFIHIDQIESDEFELVAILASQLAVCGVLTSASSENLKRLAGIHDSLVLMNAIGEALMEVEGNFKIVICLYGIEKLIEQRNTAVFEFLMKLHRIHRSPPNNLVSFCFVGGPKLLESNLLPVGLISAIGENICFFPLPDAVELEYYRQRVEYLKNIHIPWILHHKVVDKSGGHWVLYKNLVNEFENSTPVDLIAQDVWNSLPLVVRQNWNVDYLEKNQISRNLGLVKDGNIKIGLLPISQTRQEVVGNEKLPEMTAQQKLVFEHFLSRKDSIIAREELAQILWGAVWQEKYSDWAIDRMISDLKKKIKDSPWSIITLRNRGYKLVKN